MAFGINPRAEPGGSTRGAKPEGGRPIFLVGGGPSEREQSVALIDCFRFPRFCRHFTKVGQVNDFGCTALLSLFQAAVVWGAVEMAEAEVLSCFRFSSCKGTTCWVNEPKASVRCGQYLGLSRYSSCAVQYYIGQGGGRKTCM